MVRLNISDKLVPQPDTEFSKKKNIDHFLPLDKIQKKASSYVIPFIVWVYKACVVFNLVLVDLVPLVLCFLTVE